MTDPLNTADGAEEITLSELYQQLPSRLEETEPYDVEAGLARFTSWVAEQSTTSETDVADQPLALIPPEDMPAFADDRTLGTRQHADPAVTERILALEARPRAGLLIEPVEFARFTADLRALKRSSSLSDTEIAHRGALSAPDVSRLTSGAVRPSEKKTLAYVEACGGDIEEWKQRYRHMAAAVDRHRQELDREIVDRDYTTLSPPATPLRFNLQLQKRIRRGHAGMSQNEVARIAHFSPQTVSAYLKRNQIAPADFTKRMLRAVGASDEEISVWLRWRSTLDEPDNLTNSDAIEIVNADRATG